MPAMNETEYEFEVWQNEEPQASGTARQLSVVIAEASHYETMYRQDGPVEVRYYQRRRLSDDEIRATHSHIATSERSDDVSHLGFPQYQAFLLTMRAFHGEK